MLHNKRFAQQTAVLLSLKHENIIEVIGYSAKGYFETVALVTADMVNGNLANYMDGSVDMNAKFQLVSEARAVLSGSIKSASANDYIFSVRERRHEIS